MNSGKRSLRRTPFLLATLLAGASFLSAADDAKTTATPATTDTSAVPTQNEEIARLKAALAAQQKQLQALQQAIEQQQQALEHATSVAVAQPAPQPASPSVNPSLMPSNLGNVASLKPIIPVAPTAAAALPLPAPQASSSTTASNPCDAGPDSNAVPPYIRLGSVCITPVGFMDLTPYWRDKNAGSSMGSNFGSVPYNNTANGNLSEARFSIQNSRLGLRVDGDWKGVHFIGYNEFDFNGTSGSSSLSVSNGAVVPRLRLYWVDARKGKVEFLAGQSWSMLTPNRKGISALPGDLFYTQVIDINYMAGLTWSRQPGVRILYHPTETVTFGFSAEQPDQYMGGSGGGSSSVLPAALLPLQGTQLDAGLNLGACTNNTAGGATAVSYGCTGQGYLAQPAVMPDLIAKIAFDPSSRFHFEVGGIFSDFKIALNQSTTGALTVPTGAYNLHPTETGEGLLFGFNAEVFKNFRLISTNFYDRGEGRYIFGQAPDLVVNANGSLSALRSASTLDGFESRIKNTLLYAYYGAIYAGRDVVVDTNGSLVGYGYRGSSNSQNREINELSFGFNQTIWSNPRYGAINYMMQYEWLQRAPWYVAAGAPKGTHDNTIYLDIRYTLPGSMPNF